MYRKSCNYDFLEVLGKEEDDSMFLIPESNINSLTVKGKRKVAKCLCSTLNECSQDYAMIFAEHTTKYAGIIIIFNFRSLY